MHQTHVFGIIHFHYSVYAFFRNPQQQWNLLKQLQTSCSNISMYVYQSMNDFPLILCTIKQPMSVLHYTAGTKYNTTPRQIYKQNLPLKNLSLPPVELRAELCTGASSLTPLLLLPFTPCLLSTSSVILVHVVRVVFVPSCICISCLIRL